ncbi:MAG: response regulator [Mucilaginibacter sp.]|jgi:response regulator of citrate/malate metabolism
MSKLILIDDDMMYHKIAQLMVKEYSPVEEVISSTDGKATLNYLIENKENSDNLPDYIFLDLNMPEYSGWDFLKEYQKIYSSLRKAIKLYIVSSSINPNDIKRSKNYSFINSFIIKPLSREFLHELMA